MYPCWYKSPPTQVVAKSIFKEDLVFAVSPKVIDPASSPFELFAVSFLNDPIAPSNFFAVKLSTSIFSALRIGFPAVLVLNIAIAFPNVSCTRKVSAFTVMRLFVMSIPVSTI